MSASVYLVKTFRLGFLFLLVLGVLISFLPVVAQANEPNRSPWDLIVCAGEEAEGNDPACDFNQLKNLVNVVIDFVIFGLAMPIAVISIMYAGALYVLNAGNPSKRSEATKIFTNIVYGLVLMLAAYLIVKVIVLSLLGGQSNESNAVADALKAIFQ